LACQLNAVPPAAELHNGYKVHFPFSYLSLYHIAFLSDTPIQSGRLQEFCAHQSSESSTSAIKTALSSIDLSVSTMSADKEIAVIATKATGIETYKEAGSSGQASPEHGPPDELDFGAEHTQRTKKTWRDRVAYLLTKDFWFILVLGQILAICITGTNTLTTLLVIEGTSIPAFQTLFNYVLLNAMYTGYTLYKYGFKKWVKMMRKDGWKCWFKPPQMILECG
jgi:hypothetical protein